MKQWKSVNVANVAFASIWTNMGCDAYGPSETIKQPFLGWLEQLWGSCGVFSGRLAGAWKSPAPHAARVWPELLCRWFYCSHYSCYYISICVFVQPAHAVARQSTFCSFVFTAIHTYNSESLFSVCLRICCSQRLQGRVQPGGNKHLIHLSGLIWWKCQKTVFTYGEISSDMLFWCFNKQFKSGERLQHWHYLCG